ncbi:MAG: phosphomannomutase/phosphoglucomutase [Firmicutes bacterium]|nr:phosphomannomutase/phosphoglucomutase [Bacillota bacterium]
MNRNVFREYDIRGIYPGEINEELAYTVGRSYGSFLREKYNIDTCVVGHDNRLSSESLVKELIRGLKKSGCNIMFYGLVTTPMHYFSRKSANFPGIMVTASHNPKDDNGFKFSFDLVANARGNMIKEFTDYTFKGEFLEGAGEEILMNIEDEYLSWIKKNTFLGERKVKVVFDPGNGTTSIIIKKIIEMFDSIEPIYICDESDGTFPNHHPDPAVEENMEMLKQAVLDNKADLGIGYDGDGDRIGVIDEKGKWIPTDKFMIMIIRSLIKTSECKKYLYDVKCSKSLEDEIIKLGGEPFCYRTGASFTEYGVVSNNLEFGGEYSGHVFFNDRGMEFGSAIYASLRLIEILTNCNESVSDLLKGINKYYSTPEIKVKTTDEKKFEIVEKVKEYCKEKSYNILDIDGVRVTFENGWALVRASNTGPNLTIRFEATSEKELKKIEEEFMDLVNTYNN